MMKARLIIIGLLLPLLGFGQQASTMKQINKGTFVPLYGSDTLALTVNPYLLDTYPVTNQQYLEFVKKNPKWRKSTTIKLFANKNYLSHWENDTTLGSNVVLNAAATNISWYAAKAYCACQGKRLPTMNEWEYAAMASETKANAQRDSLFNQLIVAGYETPKTYQKEVGSSLKNYWGVWDMHGLVWEWTSDFNSVIIANESRNNKTGEGNLFCAGANVGASDLMDYAAFMRYAFRSSVKANYCIINLGFRCAKDIEQ